MSASFQTLATLADELATTASRLKKRAAITALLTKLHAEQAEDAGLFALYLSGQSFAETDRRKLNVGGALLSRVLAEIAGASESEFHVAYRRHGDLGAAAFDLLKGKAPEVSSLRYADVEESFAAIAAAQNGPKPNVAREALLTRLLRAATAPEAKYLIKLILGDMRIGVKQPLIEEALALASGSDLVELRHAVMLEGDILSTAQRAFAGTLQEARMRLFHPLGFMLASPVATPAEAVERFADETGETPHIAAFLEDKYDGMRVQLHCGDPEQPGRVALFSRNREEVTAAFPEIAEAFAAVKTPLILDGEVLAWDPAHARAMPFTILSQRIGRKRVTDAMRAQTPVAFMAFDLIFDGVLWLDVPLEGRRNRLEAVVEALLEVTLSPLAADISKKEQGRLFDDGEAPQSRQVQRLLLAPSRLVLSVEDIDKAYVEARDRGNEGVMLKAVSSRYQPGRRGISWVKLKRELATLDVVITSAEYGHGRRNKVLSDYTFAVRDGEVLKNIGKAYSGLTDAEIEELTQQLTAETIEDYGSYRVVKPSIVLEIAFNNVMRSTRHASGFALRFPRILHIRKDKPVSEIDTLESVEAIYQAQPDKPKEQM